MWIITSQKVTLEDKSNESVWQSDRPVYTKDGNSTEVISSLGIQRNDSNLSATRKALQGTSSVQQSLSVHSDKTVPFLLDYKLPGLQPASHCHNSINRTLQFYIERRVNKLTECSHKDVFNLLWSIIFFTHHRNKLLI